MTRGATVRRLGFTAGLAGVLCALAGCQKSVANRSLIFFTGTTLGVEASVNPSDGTGPVRLVLGYRRGEGVLNPVYEPDGVEATTTATTGTEVSVAARTAATDKQQPAPQGEAGGTGQPRPAAETQPTKTAETATAAGPVPIGDGRAVLKRYRDDAYSVIAKFSGEGASSVSSRADGKMSVAQWFATGEAAVILAKHPAIAGAVTGSPDIARAAVQAGIQMPANDPIARAQARAVLQAIAVGLQGLAATDPEAAKHLAAAEAVVNKHRPRIYMQYAFTQAQPEHLITQVQPVAAGLAGYVAYLQANDASLELLGQELKKATFEFEDRLGSRAKVTIQKDADSWKALSDELRLARQTAEAQNGVICSDPAVLKAVDYYVKTLTGTK